MRRRLKFLQRVGRFDGDRLDDIEHLRNRFAEIRDPFARENLAVAGPAGAFVALGNIDCDFAKQPERDQPRPRVSINERIAIHLHVDARFEFRFVRWSRAGIA